MSKSVHNGVNFQNKKTEHLLKLFFIGLEFASIYSIFGYTKIILLELINDFVPQGEQP